MHAHIPSSLSFIFYLLSFILILSCSPSTGPTSDTVSPRPRVTVSGAIREDTVWEEGKDYVVVGDVTVEEGATLTIQPDVQVVFDTQTGGFALTVEGCLRALGKEDKPVQFAPKHNVGIWKGIRFKEGADTSSVLERCEISKAEIGVLIESPFIEIRRSIFRQHTVCGILCAADSVKLINNQIANSTAGVEFRGSFGAQLVDTRIEECMEYGVFIAGSGVLIEGSYISGNPRGIEIGRDCTEVYISRSTISSGDFGLFLSRARHSTNIEHNTIVENEVGIYCERGSWPLVRYNNIIGNSVNAKVVGWQRGEDHPGYTQSGDIDMCHNYWGVVTEQAILRTIMDGRRPGAGEKTSSILFVPFEVAQVEDAGSPLE